ncbi:type II toxin-antitoxin system HicB family antitoxin [Methylobacterium oryzisoli]|uniref:type II toxin-antitoxin system HicB family antitoxin n=1 Tax=Methylobacterium oryzisoli TaxID=3385502 RepID=UPI003892089A
MTVHDYHVELARLPMSEGGGWQITVPDLPGCLSDGETIEEAERNVADAILCWIDAARRLGREIPPPAYARKHRA